MLQKGTFAIPADKCGVQKVSVFHLYHGFSRKVAKTGNFVKISAKRVRTNNRIKKKTKLRAFVLRTKKEVLKIDGCFVRFNSNNVILLKKRLAPQGKEIFGPMVRVRGTMRRKYIHSLPGIL